MIFFAGSLAMNGGSTFLLRIARSYMQRGKKIAVVVIGEEIDYAIKMELGKNAEIILCRDLVHPMFCFVPLARLSVFMPIYRVKVMELLERYGSCVHVMGVFGLVLAYRWDAFFKNIKITAGIYHQNELLFNAPGCFIKETIRMFKALPATNVIFFNEHNRDCYSRFFGTKFLSSLVVPIGIEIADKTFNEDRVCQIGKIVSIGNLVKFKAYNKHVINIVADLIKKFPNITYEIYGDGEQKEALQKYISKLGLDSVVRVNGAISYDLFYKYISDAMVFIGSGTAILEAASHGVPAIIGIESIDSPYSYGFLYNVPGLCYNEINDSLPLVKIEDLIALLLESDPRAYRSVAYDCWEKAQQFSIKKTVDGFNRLSKQAEVTRCRIGGFRLVLMFMSFMILLGKDLFNVDRKFRFRREQSTII